MTKTAIGSKGKSVWDILKSIRKIFADTTLPHTLATIETCLRPGREVTEMPINGF